MEVAFAVGRRHIPLCLRDCCRGYDEQASYQAGTEILEHQLSPMTSGPIYTSFGLPLVSASL
jgi:hypothetical protein